MDDPILHACPITIDSRHHRVLRNGRSILLTRIEYRLLAALVQRRGPAQSRAQLYRDVWKGRYDMKTRTVDMYVSRLRVKIGRGAKLIKTVHGVGYRFGESPSKYRGRARRRSDFG